MNANMSEACAEAITPPLKGGAMEGCRAEESQPRILLIAQKGLARDRYRRDIRRTGAIKKGDEVIGNETKVKVVKNKVAPPFKQAHFDILYGEGISREGEMIDLGAQNGIVEKSGAWYSYGGNRIGQGKENVREYLKTNPETAQEIEAKIRAKLLPEDLDIPEGDDEEQLAEEA